MYEDTRQILLNEVHRVRDELSEAHGCDSETTGKAFKGLDRLEQLILRINDKPRVIVWDAEPNDIETR